MFARRAPLALLISVSQALQLRSPALDRRGVLAQSAALVAAPFSLPLLPAHNNNKSMLLHYPTIK